MKGDWIAVLVWQINRLGMGRSDLEAAIYLYQRSSEIFLDGRDFDPLPFRGSRGSKAWIVQHGVNGLRGTVASGLTTRWKLRERQLASCHLLRP